jgi:hypothetical protein
MPTACEDIDDIEDLIAPGDLKPSDRYNNKKDVIFRGKKTKSSGENGETKVEKQHENGSVSRNE